jgi:hypothetical protein
MTNVFNALNLPIGGSTIGLGPVTVEAKYPPKATSRGTMMRNIRVTDASGSIDVTLFGDAAGLPIQDGMTVTFKGPMKRGDYNGNPKLQCDKGITIDGSSPVPVSGAYNAPVSGSTKDQQIMRQNALAHATAIVCAKGIGNSIWDAQRSVLELAEVFAKYSETGDTGVAEVAEEEEPNPY